MIFPTLFIVGSWLVLLFIFGSLGFCILRMLRFSLPKVEYFIGAIWLGWALVLVFLQIWHLFFPINSYTRVVVVIFALPCIFSSLRFILRERPSYKSLTPTAGLAILISLLCIAFVANRSLGPPPQYDAGLYHLNSIRWAKSFSIIPGLGNLHGRLAFNSTYFLYLAFLDLTSDLVRSNHLASGLLLVALTGQLVTELPRPATIRSKPISVKHIFSAIVLIPTIVLLFTQPASTAPEVPVYVLGISISLYCIKLIFTRPVEKRAYSYLFLIFVLSVIGITMKLSFLPLAGGSILISLGLYYWIDLHREDRFSQRIFYRRIATLSLAGFVVIGSWMIRGYITSGYPIYPSSIGGLPFDWQIPQNHVLGMERIIKSWARWPKMPPEEVLSSWRWLNPWFERVSSDHLRFVLPALLVLYGLILFIFTQKRMDRSHSLRTFIFLTPSICAALFWFFSAPDPRFSGASLYILGAGLISCSVLFLHDRLSKLLLGSILVINSVLLVGTMIYVLLKPVETFVAPYEVPLKSETTESGLELYLPQSGDQCWDAPLPCTPYFNANLSQRVDDNLSSGFFIETSAEDR